MLFINVYKFIKCFIDAIGNISNCIKLLLLYLSNQFNFIINSIYFRPHIIYTCSFTILFNNLKYFINL